MTAACLSVASRSVKRPDASQVFDRFGHVAELLDVVVREPHRGNGYGRALLDHAEAQARAAGAYCLYVRTYAGNDDSMTFYIHRGFVPVALHPDVHGPGDDGEVHLRKILTCP